MVFGSDDPPGFWVRIWHMAKSKLVSRPQLRAAYDVSNQELGRGSYATVVKALHKMEMRWYAVKLLPGHAEVANRARSLHREIKVMEALCHDRIVQYKEHFLEDDGISTYLPSAGILVVVVDVRRPRLTGIVLEWVPGGDLSSYLKRRKTPLRELK